MKIGIYSDPLMGKGGGTRIVVQLANHLGADVITAGIAPSVRKQFIKKVNVIDIGNSSINLSHPLGYLFEAPLRFLIHRKDDYDINIFVGNFSIFNSKRHQKNIWLCFTPNRIMYDLNDWKMKNSKIQNRLFLLLHILLFKGVDQTVARKNFIKIIAQTNTVRRRIKKYYGLRSEVFYSGINLSKFKFENFDDYYLTVGRLVPEKRMILIANAFLKTSKKLIIVGSGPEKKNLERIITGNNNIKIISKADDLELCKLYANCLATIYMPVDEDFGLVPLEGMASGKPCIAADEGGCRETVIDKKTGFLIKATEKNIINLINSLDVKTLIDMKEDCLKQARKFDIRNYYKNWDRLIYQYE